MVNAIMGEVMQVTYIRFTIVQGDRTLANGEAARGKGILLNFEPAVGGGTYKSPASTRPLEAI